MGYGDGENVFPILHPFGRIEKKVVSQDRIVCLRAKEEQFGGYLARFLKGWGQRRTSLSKFK